MHNHPNAWPNKKADVIASRNFIPPMTHHLNVVNVNLDVPPIDLYRNLVFCTWLRPKWRTCLHRQMLIVIINALAQKILTAWVNQAAIEVVYIRQSPHDAVV